MPPTFFVVDANTTLAKGGCKKDLLILVVFSTILILFFRSTLKLETIFKKTEKYV